MYLVYLFLAGLAVIAVTLYMWTHSKKYSTASETAGVLCIVSSVFTAVMLFVMFILNASSLTTDISDGEYIRISYNYENVLLVRQKNELQEISEKLSAFYPAYEKS